MCNTCTVEEDHMTTGPQPQHCVYNSTQRYYGTVPGVAIGNKMCYIPVQVLSVPAWEVLASEEQHGASKKWFLLSSYF